MTLHAKMVMPDLQRYPSNLNLKNVEDIFSIASFLINNLKKQKYLIHT